MTIHQKSRFISEAAPQPAGSQAVNLAVQAGDISVIKFEGVKVRIVNVHGVPWFIAKDVCDALELTNPSQALKALDDDEKGVTSSYTLGGAQKMRTIAESGFYKLLARSRKATTPGTLAHRFCNWVFREVIPAIRKTGAYGVPFACLHDHSRRQAQYAKEASKRGHALQSCRGEKARLKAEEAELWRTYQPELTGVSDDRI